MSRNRVVALDTLQQFTAVQLLSDPGHIGGPQLVPNVAIIRLDWSLDGGRAAFNIMHGRYSGPFAGTQTQATAIFTALTSGAQWTALAAFFGTGTQVTGVEIKDINTAGNVFIPSTGAAVPGTSVSAPLPDEVAAVISLRTAKTGIANRGRIYIPGWATNALATGNVIAPAAVTALGNWAQTIKTAMAAQGYTMCIAQPARAEYTGSTGTVHPARAASSTDVSTLLVRDNHWDSQRKRGLK